MTKTMSVCFESIMQHEAAMVQSLRFFLVGNRTYLVASGNLKASSLTTPASISCWKIISIINLFLNDLVIVIVI